MTTLLAGFEVPARRGGGACSRNVALASLRSPDSLDAMADEYGRSVESALAGLAGSCLSERTAKFKATGSTLARALHPPLARRPRPSVPLP